MSSPLSPPCSPLWLSLLLLAACGRSAPEGPTLLLVTLDTTRADRLGCYGRADAGTPVLDEIARQGVRFDAAYTVAPLTCPAHSSLITGLVPPVHGVRDNGTYSLPEEAETLAELMAAEGWRTGAFIGAFPLAARFGLAQGFEVYDDQFDARRIDSQYDERTADRVVDAALGWVDTLATEDSVLLWVHLFDPHRPWRAPQQGADPYQDEIRYVDAELGRLLDGLGAAGRDSALTVVVVADHGEGLGDHEEKTHTQLLYDTTLRVPMLIRGPELPAGLVVEDTVSLVDVLPTLTTRYALSAPAELSGRDLSPLWTGAGLAPRGAYAETLFPELHNGWSRLYAWVGAGEKLIHAPGADSRRYELFDLRADPSELNDLASADTRRTSTLAGQLQRFLDELPAPLGDALAPADDDTIRRLEALGYVAPEPRADQRGRHPADMIYIADLFYVVRGLARAKRLDDAREKLAEVSARDPGGMTELELRGEIALVAGKSDPAQLALAEELFREATQRSPQRRSLWRSLVRVQRERGKLSEALDSLSAARALGLPTQALLDEQSALLDLLRSLAFGLEDAKQHAEALGLWQRILAVEPEDRAANSAVARLEVRLGR